jgi:HK97 family phage portal protein
MTISAVFACIQLIAGAVASLPLPVYRIAANGDRERVDHANSWFVNQQASPVYSSSAFWSYIILSKCLHGDGFARIHRVTPYTDDVAMIEPLHPLCVQVCLNPNNKSRRLYVVTNSLTGITETIDQDDILHFSGLGFNGLRSLSPLRYSLKFAGGIALAADNFSADFFGEGTKPEFVIKTQDAKLTEDQKNIIQSAWSDLIAGNRRKPGVLGKGMDITELTISAEDAQLIATRQFQVEDIARAFGVPPFMIGHTTNTTSWGSGVEQMGIGFVKYTLSRHLVGIEQECNHKLFERPFFCEFMTAGLERGDTIGRFNAYRVALGRAGEPGFMTVNEVRKAENLPPVTDGDLLNTSTAPSVTVSMGNN